MLTHFIYEKKTGKIIQMHTFYKMGEELPCACSEQEVMAVIDPSIDRSKVAIASVDIQSGISARDKNFKIDVASGALIEEAVK